MPSTTTIPLPAVQALRKLGLKAATLDAYASAFDHELMDEARRLLKG